MFVCLLACLCADLQTAVGSRKGQVCAGQALRGYGECGRRKVGSVEEVGQLVDLWTLRSVGAGGRSRIQHLY